MQKKISSSINENIKVSKLLIKDHLSNIEKVAKMMLSAIKKGNKIIIFGNGGSAADSIHIAAELVGKFHKKRRALPAIALTSNISTLTALGNDFSFDYIFERQIEAFGEKGDVALGISTSGKSKNVIRGIEKAKKLNLKTAVLVGKNKTKLSQIADISIRVPSDSTPRIQEAHITIGHIICEIIENAL